jgi:ABC-type Fe3+-hydroxamate transport system substrate-binding protein
MARLIGTLLLCIILLIQACGCASTKAVSMDQFEKEPQPGITSLVLNDWSRVEFVPFQGETGKYVNGEIVGVVRSGEKVHIPIAKVRTVSYNDSGASNTAVLVGVAVIGVAAIVYWLATFKISFRPSGQQH